MRISKMSTLEGLIRKRNDLIREKNVFDSYIRRRSEICNGKFFLTKNGEEDSYVSRSGSLYYELEMDTHLREHMIELLKQYFDNSIAQLTVKIKALGKELFCGDGDNDELD